mgnify:CR=1 FL=1
MGKRLSENLSSLYIGAANKLKPKCSRRKIIAYVESYDDISFWRTLLGEYENETSLFRKVCFLRKPLWLKVRSLC